MLFYCIPTLYLVVAYFYVSNNSVLNFVNEILSYLFVTIQSHAHINAYARIKAFICIWRDTPMRQRCARQCDFANGVLNSYIIFNPLNRIKIAYLIQDSMI